MRASAVVRNWYSFQAQAEPGQPGASGAVGQLRVQPIALKSVALEVQVLAGTRTCAQAALVGVLDGRGQGGHRGDRARQRIVLFPVLQFYATMPDGVAGSGATGVNPWARHCAANTDRLDRSRGYLDDPIRELLWGLNRIGSSQRLTTPDFLEVPSTNPGWITCRAREIPVVAAASVRSSCRSRGCVLQTRVTWQSAASRLRRDSQIRRAPGRVRACRGLSRASAAASSRYVAAG